MTTIAACESQPITAQGLAAILNATQEFRLVGAAASLAAADDLLHRQGPDTLILDKAFGVQAVLEWIAERRTARPPVQLVVWGLSISEAEALRFLQIGARGILKKTAPAETLLNCLRAVSAGTSWMEDSLFRETARPERYPRSELTPREQQVMELVEQGYRNKDIARQLGIRPGTVKIHLKHIFEKTGVRGRYGLALSGMKEKGLLALP